MRRCDRRKAEIVPKEFIYSAKEENVNNTTGQTRKVRFLWLRSRQARHM